MASESGQDCFPSCRLLHLASFMSPGRATDYRYAKLAALQALTNKVRRSSSLRPARAVLLDRNFRSAALFIDGLLVASRSED
jgi:hypothetical protein